VGSNGLYWFSYYITRRLQRSATPENLRILVLADTHNKLPPAIADLAATADEIWHLGDVCTERILDELRAIGPPVTVARGNCDSNFEWPLVVDLVRSGLKFRLQHIPPAPRTLAGKDVDIVLHGHTHIPRNEKRNSMLFLNPGCVTRPNRGSPASVAWLEIADGKVNWRLVRL
jgi:putative phosphoesterase